MAHNETPPSHSGGGVYFRDAAQYDAAALAAFAAAAFTETFAHLYPPEDLASFLGEKFGAVQQSAEIADADAHVRIALIDDAIVGFCKTGILGMDVPERSETPLELHRLYVGAAVKGAGVAQALMDDALGWARARGADAIYLSVWENNFRAQRFYKRYGFEHVAEHGFMVGRVRDNDYIWRLDLCGGR
jgi:diamine N-acetyltransferase